MPLPPTPTLAAAMMAVASAAAIELGTHHANPNSNSSCMGMASNRGAIGVKTVLDAHTATLLKPFARQYASALESSGDDVRPLTRLSTTRVWRWSRAGYGPSVHFGAYINAKLHILHAYEVLMGVRDLWTPANSVLDVGSGPGWMGAYLMARYGTKVVAYDIPFTSECAHFLESPFTVNFFWKTLPEEQRSHDAVTFMNVLHHAAEQTPALLRQAAAIARRYILVTEDTLTGPHVNRVMLKHHDSRGIFRTDDEWKAVFAEHCEGFVLRRSGPLFMKVQAAAARGDGGTRSSSSSTTRPRLARAGGGLFSLFGFGAGQATTSNTKHSSAKSSTSSTTWIAIGVNESRPFTNGYRYYVLERRL